MPKKKTFIPALGYKWLSAFYDRIFRIFLPERKMRQTLVDELSLKDGENVLEFGIGTGQNLIFAYNSNNKIRLSGIDIDPSMKILATVKIEKNRIPAFIDLYDGNTLPYENNSFDKVYSTLVFHHLDSVSKTNCLAEINRVLKPGGWLIIGDWGKARNFIMRIAYFSVQLLDGFSTTSENVKGMIPDYIRRTKFTDIQETENINTIAGSFSFYRARKTLT